MKFVNPTLVTHAATNLKGGLQLAEFAGRLCYKSENNIEPESYQKFLLMIIDKGHTSILEHCPIYICGYQDKLSEDILKIKLSHFSRFIRTRTDVCMYMDFNHIYSNLRVVYDINPELAKQLIMTSTIDGNEIWRKHGVSWFTPELNHPFTRISAYITTLRSIVDELVRERVTSDAIESTRWCDYSNNKKFDGITFCLPHWINKDRFDVCFHNFIKDCSEANIQSDYIEKLYEYEDIAFCLYQNTNELEDKRCYHYIRAAVLDDILYNEGRDELKLPAQDAREYLFLGIKSEMYYTCYNEDWDNILDKRLYDKYGKSHENMHIIMQACEDHLNSIRNSQNNKKDERESESASE